MDRAWASRRQHPAAMRVAGAEPFELVPGAGGRDAGEPGLYAADRRGIPAASRVRLASDDGLVGPAGARGESQTYPASDAEDGSGGDLRQAAVVAAGPGGADLPVFAAECGDRAPEPGVEHGHYLRAVAGRFYVSDGSAGLVQPIRAVVGAVGELARRVLLSGAGGGVG